MASAAAPSTADSGAGPLQRTLALIKPDAAGVPWVETYAVKIPPPEDAPEEEAKIEKWDTTSEIRAADKATEIIARINRAGFHIVTQKLVHLSKAQAEQFYAEHAGKPFFETLTSFMSSGPTLAMVLERENAIAEWRAVMGMTNATRAREAAEAAHPLNEDLWSIRALFGTDGTRNATHGSDSEYSAAREIGFFFPEPETFERAVAVVLPQAVAAGRSDAVVAALEADDFFILARRITHVSAEAASTVLGPDASQASVAALTSGAAEVFLVERMGAGARLNLLVGPPPTVARASVPASLHAQIGADDVNVGVIAVPSSRRDAAVQALFPDPLPVEHTLAVIKPVTADKHYRAIVADIIAAGFSIVDETKRTLSREEVEAFYQEHAGKPFFNGLCGYMCSAPVVALALAKPNAIKCWRQMMGPTNFTVAQRERPSCLRARFGMDGTRNALHGSDSPASAARELRFYFPDLSIAPVSGDAALTLVKATTVSTVYDPTRKALVPKTLEGVIVDALAELARAKPSTDPAAAIRWLGQWLVDNNPAHGKIAGGADAGGRVVVHEPDEDVAAGAAAMPRGPVGAPAPVTPPTIVFVLGGPGSGKGTQCDRIVAEFGFKHLSTGDLLRAEVASGSARGNELQAVMKAGGLVSDDVVLQLLKDAMAASGASKFLVDGYPRTLAQATAFEQAIAAPRLVLAFEASDAVLESRLLDRGRTSGRADDNIEAIRQRLATFKQQSAPVIDFYSKLGLVRRINSERAKDEVYRATRPHLLPELVWLLGLPGSGRTTVGRELANSGLGYHYVDVHAAAAAEVAAASELGHVIAPLLAHGDPLPSHAVVSCLQRAFARNPLGRYLIDGAPRDEETALAMERAFGPPRAVVHLDVDAATALKRATAGLTARDGVKKAAALYTRLTVPVLARYQSRGIVRRVDASCALAAVVADARQALAPEVVFVLGGPGSGKGTQCARIAAEFEWLHVSAGDLLRAEVERGSAQGTLIQTCLKEGAIVPLEITLELLRQALIASRTRRVLVDGFPRDVGQAIAFERTVATASFVLFFDCPASVMRERILDRGKTSGRVDDNEASIAKRLQTFATQSMPVIEHYAASGKVQTIDATPAPADVFSAVSQLFVPRMIITTGLPGAGKTTLASSIASEFGFTHISVGGLLRAEVAAGTDRAEVIEAAQAAGRNVSDELVLDLVQEAMQRAPGRRFILDDVPATAEQAEAFDKRFGAPRLVLQLDVDKDSAKARLVRRGKTSGRADDTEATISKRLAAHESAGPEVLAHYAAAGVLRHVAAAAPAVAVFAEVRPMLQPTLALLVGTVGSGRKVLARRAGRELGYHTIRVTDLLRAEMDRASAAGKAIAAAFATHRTAPVDVVLDVIRSEIRRSPARQFLLDGFPRTVSAGFPGIHDQVFALERDLGVVRGCISLDATVEVRAARLEAKTAGERAALQAKVETYRREKAPLVAFMQKIGKAAVVDTTSLSVQEVYDAALPLLQ